jgi:V8-like Glu-specific endopeptidase
VPAEPTLRANDSGQNPPRGRRRAGVAEFSRGHALVLMSALLASVIAVVAAIVGVTLLSSPSQAARVPMPAAGAGDSRTVGAIFTTSAGRLGSHFCSGSVVDSPSGDLVLTAAHCVSGRSQLAFVPDYSNGHEPYGVWQVSRVIVDKNWQSSSDADDDFAFLTVYQAGTRTSLQARTGGETLGIGEPAGQTVTVAGYPDDLNAQVSCQNVATAFGTTQLQFDCGGFPDGTSGSPFLAGAASAGEPGVVIGVIGGYERGGLTPSVSYAARFGPSMAALYATAIADGSS